MEKEFVPYEQACELKQLGFDEPCFTWYWDDIGLYNGLEFGNHNKKLNIVSAPTFSQAFRFFREKYNLDGFVQGRGYERKKYYINTINGTWNPLECTFNSPEEAEFRCMKKLIELVKNK
jgi:hypothetical protein